VLATLAAVALVAGAFVLGRGGDDPDEIAADDTTTTDADPARSTTTTTTTTTTPPTTAKQAPSTNAPPKAAPAPAPSAAAGPGDVRTLGGGLFCRDLAAQGYSYAAAVDYWRSQGQPDRMDADLNGIPCETVYPRAAVVAYWPTATYQAVPSYGLPAGLFCRDLAARGIDVYGALTYFIWEGSPARMDADGNGIPCETVYPDATQVWLSEF
jgi:hypothetical protein